MQLVNSPFEERYGKRRVPRRGVFLASLTGVLVFLAGVVDVLLDANFLDGLAITPAIIFEMVRCTALGIILHLSMRHSRNVAVGVILVVLALAVYGGLPGVVATFMYSSCWDSPSTIMLSMLGTYIGSVSGVVALVAAAACSVLAFTGRVLVDDVS